MRSAPASLLLLVVAACSKNAAAPADAGSSPTTASLTLGVDASSAAATPDAAPAGPCQLEAGPFLLDKGVRSETGVTLVRLADGRLAAGYANGEGRPKVATFDLDGVPTLFDVDIANLPELGQKPAPKTTRSVHRVTPLGTTGITMRAAVDVSEVEPNGVRKIQCGPADGESGWASFHGVSAYEPSDAGVPGDARELRECRSFVSGTTGWSLEFAADTSGAVESRWMVAGSDERFEMGTDLLLQHQLVPPEPGHVLPRAVQVERYGYTLLTAIRFEGGGDAGDGADAGSAGFLLGARSNGKLRLTKRAADWSAIEEPTDFWFGSPVGLSSLTSRDGKLVVLAPLAGKRDLYGATFAATAKISKPEPIVLDDPPGAPPPSADAERTAVTAAIGAQGKVVVAFLEGRSGKRRPRFALLDDRLKPSSPTFEPLATGDADVADLKLLSLPDDRVLAASLVARPGGGLTLEASVLACH